jgi:hypothetical protein
MPWNGPKVSTKLHKQTQGKHLTALASGQTSPKMLTSSVTAFTCMRLQQSKLLLHGAKVQLVAECCWDAVMVWCVEA